MEFVELRNATIVCEWQLLSVVSINSVCVVETGFKYFVIGGHNLPNTIITACSTHLIDLAQTRLSVLSAFGLYLSFALKDEQFNPCTCNAAASVATTKTE